MIVLKIRQYLKSVEVLPSPERRESDGYAAPGPGIVVGPGGDQI